LRRLSSHLHERFDTDTMRLDDVDRTILDWRDAVVEGRAAEEGWPGWINIPSKVGQVAAVRVLARERRAADAIGGTLVAAICPDCSTRRRRARGSRTWRRRRPRRRALAPLRLALDPAADLSFYGELIQFGKVIPWR
jgi:hypothetical protein